MISSMETLKRGLTGMCKVQMNLSVMASATSNVRKSWRETVGGGEQERR